MNSVAGYSIAGAIFDFIHRKDYLNIVIYLSGGNKIEISKSHEPKSVCNIDTFVGVETSTKVHMIDINHIIGVELLKKEVKKKVKNES